MTTITEEATEAVSPTLDEAIAIGLDGLPPATDANLHYLANTDFNGVHVKAAARELLVRRYMASRPSAPQAEGRDTGLREADWGSSPTPPEAAEILRGHARKRNVGPGDNDFEDAAKIIDRLWSERPSLLAALLPFADVDGEGDEDFSDTEPVTVKFGRSTVYTLKLGDFRRARAFCTRKGPK